MLPNVSLLPHMAAHLVVCAAVGLWVFRRLGPAPRPWTVVFAVARLTAVGLAFGVVVAPGPVLSDAFALLLAWSWTLGIVLPAALVVGGVGLVRRRERVGWALITAGAATVALAVHAFAFEPYALEVTRHRVVSSRVRAPLRIAVIADLQTDDPGAYEAAALREVVAARPDVIVLPGDFIQHTDRERYATAWASLRTIVDEVGLAAPLGVYAVGGDVEHAGWQAELAGTGVVALDGAVALRDDVDLVGLDLRRSRGGVELERQGEAFTVVFGHAPDFALGPVDADLLLAGHTHGGQVQLPWFGPLVTLTDVPRSWASGRSEVDDDTTLIVSRGVGMERGTAPRLRLWCRPQVVIVDVVPGAG